MVYDIKRRYFNRGEELYIIRKCKELFMLVLLAEHAGYCFGVKNAIENMTGLELSVVNIRIASMDMGNNK